MYFLQTDETVGTLKRCLADTNRSAGIRPGCSSGGRLTHTKETESRVSGATPATSAAKTTAGGRSGSNSQYRVRRALRRAFSAMVERAHLYRFKGSSGRRPSGQFLHETGF